MPGLEREERTLEVKGNSLDARLLTLQRVPRLCQDSRLFPLNAWLLKSRGLTEHLGARLSLERAAIRREHGGAFRSETQHRPPDGCTSWVLARKISTKVIQFTINPTNEGGSV